MAETTIRPAGPQPPAMPVAQRPNDKPRLVEVELRRKYCPFWLIQDDGSAVAQDSTKPTVTVEPGIVKLHHEDAVTALNAGAASPTHNTFKAGI